MKLKLQYFLNNYGGNSGQNETLGEVGRAQIEINKIARSLKTMDDALARAGKALNAAERRRALERDSAAIQRSRTTTTFAALQHISAPSVAASW